MRNVTRYTVGPLWLLFILIVALMIAVQVALSAEESRIDLECDATHCRITRQDLLLIVRYVKLLESRQGKSCT